MDNHSVTAEESRMRIHARENLWTRLCFLLAAIDAAFGGGGGGSEMSRNSKNGWNGIMKAIKTSRMQQFVGVSILVELEAKRGYFAKSFDKSDLRGSVILWLLLRSAFDNWVFFRKIMIQM